MINVRVKYYKRYEHFRRINDLGRVESFRVIKSWARGKTLDVGCGVGYITNYPGAIGIDVNAAALKLAKKYYPHLDVIRASCEALPFRTSCFDTILCYNVLEHLTENERMKTLKEVKRVLNDKGYFISGMADLKYIVNIVKGLLTISSTHDPTHRFNWGAEDFKKMVYEDFDIVEEKRASGYGRFIWIAKYLKGDILLRCRARRNLAH